MFSARSVRQRFIAGLALAVMLLAATVPVPTHAVAVSTGQPPALWDICTNVQSGIDEASVPHPSDSSHGQPLATKHGHCPFCLSFVDRLAALPALVFSFIPAEWGWVRPGTQAIFVARLFHEPALPRGPPFSRF